MKLIIEHGSSKREISGSFNICGSRADLEFLVSELRHALSDERWIYGWVSIVPGRQHSIDTPPKAWEES